MIGLWSVGWLVYLVVLCVVGVLLLVVASVVMDVFVCIVYVVCFGCYDAFGLYWWCGVVVLVWVSVCLVFVCLMFRFWGLVGCCLLWLLLGCIVPTWWWCGYCLMFVWGDMLSVY